MDHLTGGMGSVTHSVRQTVRFHWHNGTGDSTCEQVLTCLTSILCNDTGPLLLVKPTLPLSLGTTNGNQTKQTQEHFKLKFLLTLNINLTSKLTDPGTDTETDRFWSHNRAEYLFHGTLISLRNGSLTHFGLWSRFGVCVTVY